MKWQFGIFIVGVLLVLTYFASRQPNPVNTARANEIQLLAEQRAADAELARQQLAQLNEIKIQERAARSAAIRTAWNNTVVWGGRMAVLAIVALGISLVINLASLFSGLREATVTRVQNNAELIWPDPKTGLLPVKLTIAEDHLFATNLNTGQTRQLDLTHEADAQLVAGYIAVQYAGVIARNIKAEEGQMRGSVDAPIVHPQQIDLESLKNLLEVQERSDDNA